MSDDEPELRERPPWVMEEMIEAQRTLPAAIAAHGGVERLAEPVAEATRTGGPIVVCGCGTSEHAARAIHAILAARAPAARLAVADAFEAQLDPPDRGLLIAVSHDGRTVATRRAAVRAAGRGARALMITARPEHVPEGVEAVPTPARDRSWCHTLAYTSAILTCALGEGLTVTRAEALIEAGLAEREPLRRDAAALAGCARLVVVGSGVDEVTAAELALKIEEAAHLPCTPLGVEKVLHGHLPAADATTGAVILRFDRSHAGRRDGRAATVAAAAAVLEMPTVTLSGPETLATRAEALLRGALTLQLFTLGLAHALGTNPDLIRREDPRYRRVAEVAGGG